MYAVFPLIVIFIVDILINIALYLIQFEIIPHLYLLHFAFLTLYLAFVSLIFNNLLNLIMVSFCYGCLYLAYLMWWFLLCHFHLKCYRCHNFFRRILFNVLELFRSISGTEASAAWEKTFFIIFIRVDLTDRLRLILFIGAYRLENARLQTGVFHHL